MSTSLEFGFIESYWKISKREHVVPPIRIFWIWLALGDLPSPEFVIRWKPQILMRLLPEMLFGLIYSRKGVIEKEYEK